MTIPNTTEEEKRMKTTVRLEECAKSRCGHVLTSDEYVWIEDGDREFPSSTGTCPKCGNDSFYTLNASGQYRKSGDETPREIEVEDINPSPRMGLKKRRRIFAAKERAKQRITEPFL